MLQRTDNSTTLTQSIRLVLIESMCRGTKTRATTKGHLLCTRTLHTGNVHQFAPAAASSEADAKGNHQGTRLMVIHESMVDPNVAEILTGFGTLFRECAIPVLL